MNRLILTAGIGTLLTFAAHAGTAPWFTPLTSSVPVPTNEFTNPFTSPAGFTFTNLTSMQEIEADPLQSTVRVPALGSNGTMWDMVAFDNTSRYVFIPHETQYGAGLSRYDKTTDTTVRLFQGDGLGVGGNWANDYGALDPAVWTPHNTLLVAEEWSGQGRLLEVTNPTTAGLDGATKIWRSNIPSVSHEGLKFDSTGAMYFVDEFASGSIYKFVPTVPGDLSLGQTFVLRIGGGGVDNVAGAATWVPMTNAAGLALTVANPFDFNNRGGRLAADELLGTGYNRPEDLEIGILETSGKEVLYFAATGTNSIYSIELNDPTNATVRLMANAATPKNVGFAGTTGTLGAPDNLAIDANGNIYVIEDNPNGGTTGGDTWFLRDEDGDGVAESLDHFLSFGGAGAEATGMIWDVNNPTQFLIASQHPNSTGSSVGSAAPGDSLWLVTVPEPSTAVLALCGMGFFAGRRRRKD